MLQPTVHATCAAALRLPRCRAALQDHTLAKLSPTMNNSPDQLDRLLQQATDIIADLHNLYLLHTGQVDNQFQCSFPPLPPPPSFTIPLPSPTSSCDSAPVHRHSPAPRKPAASLDSSSPTPIIPQPLHPKKRRQPAPPLNSQANWDDWDGEADCRLVELKTDPQLRPNWSYVARCVGFSIEQCKARWQEVQEWQPIHEASTPPHLLSPHSSPAICPTPTSPAKTQPATPLQ